MDVFGKRALIQRCQEHKKRNVADQLPESLRPSVRRAMNEAYESSDPKRALRLLENLATRLESEHPGAAASLREGLAETLTVIELGLTGRLRLTLRTTNPIDNLFGSVRKLSRRVKRWRGGRMMLRWCASCSCASPPTPTPASPISPPRLGPRPTPPTPHIPASP
jgi:putative transposase